MQNVCGIRFHTSAIPLLYIIIQRIYGQKLKKILNTLMIIYPRLNREAGVLRLINGLLPAILPNVICLSINTWKLKPYLILSLPMVKPHVARLTVYRTLTG